IENLDADQGLEDVVKTEENLDADQALKNPADVAHASESLTSKGMDLNAEKNNGLVTVFRGSDFAKNVELNGEFNLHEEMVSLDSDLSDLSKELRGVDLNATLQPESVNAGEESDLDSAVDDSLREDVDIDFLEKADEAAATQLDLARAYIEMGDQEGAKDILNKVVQEGSDVQKQEADELLRKL
ncbi:MAG: hypothetical protein KAG53_04640, partial [Endozoicomonadaceae bacterium]|nr:hypothetical protein [Endozoicomonadaceae bacterium]